MNKLNHFVQRSLAIVMLISIAATNTRAVEPIAGDVLKPLSHRFASADNNSGATAGSTLEEPDFQRHIGPLLGRLGCNGRACHGSFQGRGGFQLSLFGYDFSADHKALLDPESGRVDTEKVSESLILAKPIDEEMHEGGKRMEIGSWQYRVLERWIASGAKFTGNLQSLDRLEVTPNEILFGEPAESIPLHVIAHWTDGTKEDVTELCRFTTNDDSVALIDENGIVSSKGAGDTHVVIAYDKAVVPVAVMRPLAIDAAGVAGPPSSNHPIDQLVKVKLDKLHIVPSQRCSDSDFIRRASLDVTGLLPSPERVKAFLADQSPTKREQLIDELLEQPSYAAWWATRMSDWTGNNEEMLNNYFPVRGAASKFWYSWLERRISENMPYDEIVEGLVQSESRLPDESYVEYCETMSEACREGDTETFASRPGVPQFWARKNFRTPEDRAIGFAYTFLGVRIQCAQCHKHPFDRWSKQDFEKFSVLFSSVQAGPNTLERDSREARDEMLTGLLDGKELKGGELRRKIYDAVREGETVPFPELVVLSRPAGKPNVPKDKKAKKKNPRAQPAVGNVLGELDSISLASDPRASLMDWLREEDNPYFAKALVNRVWANYFGIGIVNPTDDMNLGNPPSNGPLLDFLAQEFVNSEYDLKALHRLILLSDTYQRSSQANVTNAADQRNFSRHVPHRLPAEVIRDAVLLATANDRDAAKARTDMDTLAIAGLGTFERQNNREFALRVFGTSMRESNCDCDRSDMPNVLQAIYLQNDIDVHRRLSQSNGWVAETSSKVTGMPLKERGVQLAGKKGDKGIEKRKLEAIQSTKASIAKRVSNFKSLPPKRQAQMRTQLEKELEKLNARLERLGGETMTLEQQLVMQVPGQTSAAQATSPRANASKPVVDNQVLSTWVQEAYLRTLTRKPDAEEIEIAMSFLKEAPHPGEGLESLMWTLMNTKEFILSH
jgi:hypothetical protein